VAPQPSFAAAMQRSSQAVLQQYGSAAQIVSTQALQPGASGPPSLQISWAHPQVSPQPCAAAWTQRSSQAVLQQYGSAAHTLLAQLSQAASSGAPAAHSSWAQAGTQVSWQTVSTASTH
jgi:hypothetical protein